MENVQQNYIGGTWVSAGTTARNVNPSNLNDAIGNCARARPAEAEAAVAAAKAAFPAYSRSTPQERYEALKKISDEIFARKDELGRLLSREEGKTLPEGIARLSALDRFSPSSPGSRCGRPARRSPASDPE
jgi:acyl-CoA reductase-like NAD-dependent aldehyde dehydrogenase